MADEDLIYRLGADTSGLDAAERRHLAFLDRYVSAVEQVNRARPALDIDVVPVERSLARGRTALERFVKEARDVTIAPKLDVGELEELRGTFGDLVRDLRQSDPTGILQKMAQQSRATVDELLALARAQREAVTQTPLPAAVAAPIETQSRRQTEVTQAAVAQATRLAQAEDAVARQLEASRVATEGRRQSLEAMTAAEVQAGLAAVRAGALIEARSRAVIAATQQEAQALRLANAVAREATATPPPPPVDPNLARGFEAFERGVAQSQVRADEARQKIERLNATMLQSGQAARRASGDNEAAAAALGRMGEQQRRVDQAQASSARNANILRGSLTALALEATGTAGPLGRLASAALVFSAGTTAAVVGIGVVAALATAWRALTEDARRASEAQKDALRSFESRVAGQAGADPATQRGAARGRIQTLQVQELDLERRIADAGIDVGQQLALRFRLQLNLNEQKRLTRALIRDEGEAERDAAQEALRARVAATRQATADVTALEQQEIRGRETALRAQFAQELITREQFYSQRITLAREAAAAELQALRADQSLLTIVPVGETSSQRTAREAEIRHFDRLIQIRERGLTQQVQELRNEQALAEFAERKARLAEQREIRLTQSGRGNLVQGSEGRGIIPTTDPAFTVEPIEIPVILRGATAREELDTITTRAERARDRAERLGDAINDIGRGVDGLAEAGVNIGLIGESADRGILSVLDLGDAIAEVVRQSKDLQKGLSFSSVAGLVGTGLNLVSQFTGVSPEEQERRDITRRNIDALERNTAAILIREGGAAGLGREQETITTLLAQRELLNRAQFDKEGGSILLRGSAADAREQLDEELRGLGTSFAELNALAKERFGIDLLDSKGRIVAESFELLKQRMDEAIDAITHFSDTIEGRRSVLETEDRLGLSDRSEDDRVAAIQRTRELQLGGLELSDAEERRVRGLDLTTAEGRQEFLEFQRDLFQRAQRGELSPEELGLFKSVDELRGTIDDAADGVNAFDEALGDASRTLQGVPDFFNLAEAEFMARRGGPIGNDGARLPLGLNDVFPTPVGGFPTLTPSDAALFARTAGIGPVTNIYFMAPITQQIQGGNRSPEAIAREARDALLGSAIAQGFGEDAIPGVSP